VIGYARPGQEQWLEIGQECTVQLGGSGTTRVGTTVGVGRSWMRCPYLLAHGRKGSDPRVAFVVALDEHPEHLGPNMEVVIELRWGRRGAGSSVALLNSQ
jgi:hypothetical protein